MPERYVVGMNNVRFQRPLQRLRRCNETVVDACEPDRVAPADKTLPTAGCCAIIPCEICVELDLLGTIYNAIATWDGDQWTAVINGIDVAFYWDQPADCSFFVYFDGVEVYEAPRCLTPEEEAAGVIVPTDCRSPSGSVTVTVGADSGTLSWFVVFDRTLARLEKNTERCADYWCGNCDCICEEMCATITAAGGDYGGVSCRTILTLNAFDDCDDFTPTWSGTVDCLIGKFDIVISIVRATVAETGIAVGDCKLLYEVYDYDEFGDPNTEKIPTAIVDTSTKVLTCSTMAYEISLQGYTITGSCLRCDECVDPPIDCGECTFIVRNVPTDGLVWTLVTGCSGVYCTCGGATTTQTVLPNKTPDFDGELYYCPCDLPAASAPGDPTSVTCDEE
jgi:hypothetical protein